MSQNKIQRNGYRRCLQNLSIVFASLLMLSCDAGDGGSVRTDGNGGMSLAFGPPSQVLQARNVAQEALSVVVAIDGSTVQLARGEDGQWFGTLMVPRDATFDVTVTWSESFEGSELVLAQAIKPVTVEAGAVSADVTFRSNEFNTSFDADGDGQTNLDERRDGTGPFNDEDSMGAPVVVTLDMRIALPEILEDAPEDALELVSARLRVAAGDRENQIWIGSTTAIDQSDTFFTVDFFVTSNPSIRLAMRRQSVFVDGGGATEIDGSDYDMDFNDDQDDLSNIEEIKAGSNPRDSNSPEFDPCVPSRFGAGCTQDFDLDGKPDSEETEDADTDNDGIPDYRESDTTDIDRDGFSRERDAEDDNPCVPSSDTAPCRALTLDTDEDGETDVDEGNGDQDGDGIPDREESDEVDTDSDGLSDEADADNTDPCEPRSNNEACRNENLDSDDDGETDREEGNGDRDGDGIPDREESDEVDTDGDRIVDEADVDNTDPCEPRRNNAACRNANRDSDDDGETDLEEGNGDADGDGMPDREESDEVDQDGDLFSNEADPENANPCVPNPLSDACRALRPDTDEDGETDLEETLTADEDDDGIPDYLEPDNVDSDRDGLHDEEDPANDDPCEPDPDNAACADADDDAAVVITE